MAISEFLFSVQLKKWFLTKTFSYSDLAMEIEWTSIIRYIHELCICVMPFPLTRPEVYRNLEYFVALNYFGNANFFNSRITRNT